ncbi:hypothetical protein AN958_05413 [Leucoagaricus sp. SymC.cos]|nr:hypothetical protein AN958_05413 [Leucoagaricus sp. SymC.cos]
MNQNIGQIFRVMVQYNQKNWVDKASLVEFAINSSISTSTKFAPFELNYGYLPSMIQDTQMADTVHQGVKTFTEAALLNIAAVHDVIIKAQVFQTCQANKR